MQRYITSSAAETEALAERLAGQLRGGEVIAFVGGMGMGKTCFTHGWPPAWASIPGRYPAPPSPW